MPNMSSSPDAIADYYDRRADEYDATSWEYTGGDSRVVKLVQEALGSLSYVDTLDVGCGTGYVSRWLPGRLTLIDASAAMLSIAKRRLVSAACVRGRAPLLPFTDSSFARIFTGNLYGHLALPVRLQLVEEMFRVAEEFVVLDQLSSSDEYSEGPELRQLMDGSAYAIHKCYFTLERLLQELGGGDILMAGPVFAIIRRRR